MAGADITANAAFTPVCADNRSPDASRREGLGYGVKARLARTLGVSKVTITVERRDGAGPLGGGRQRPLA